VDVLVFPVAGRAGLWAHGAGSTVALLAILAALGLDALVARVGALRGWRSITDPLAPIVLLPPLVALALTLPLMALAGALEHERATVTGAQYEALAARAAQWGLDAGRPVVTDHPMWVNATFGGTAIALPRERPPAIVELARRFGAVAIVARDPDAIALLGELAGYRTPQGAACFEELPTPPPFRALAFTCASELAWVITAAPDMRWGGGGTSYTGREARRSSLEAGPCKRGAMAAETRASGRRRGAPAQDEAEKRTRIVLVDDHALFRLGMRHLLEREADFEVIGEAEDARSAIEMAVDQNPDVVLMDLSLPSPGGIEATQRIKRQLPTTAVIVLAAAEDEDSLFDAIKAGAAAFILKEVNPADLVAIIRRVSSGEYLINDKVFSRPAVASRVLKEFRELAIYGQEAAPIFAPLSPREVEILDNIAQGMTNKQVAYALTISEQTVKNHMSSILRKLSVNDRTQAVVYAMKQGWIRLPED
jgi:DNA-binding NarL/FixJ family response regulator